MFSQRALQWLYALLLLFYGCISASIHSSATSTSLISKDYQWTWKTCQVPQASMYSPCACYSKSLSTSLKFSHSLSSLSPPESLPVQVFELISESLTFFDKKSLQFASRQTYHVMGSVKCPDALSRVMHICWTARNSCIYDYSLSNPHKVAEILKGMGLRLGSPGFIPNMYEQTRMALMRYCSEDVWYLFPGAGHISISREFHFRHTWDLFTSPHPSISTESM